MRWWQPTLTGIAGLAVTLALALWLDVRAGNARVQPQPEAPAPTPVTLGDPRADGELVFPFERYIVDGETQWLPLLRQLGDPELLEADKRACIPHLAGLAEDESCRVEYVYSLDPAGRVPGIAATLMSGDADACRAYVECRLPGLASVRLEVPASELLARPAGLRIVDKVTHASRRPGVADEQRELAELTQQLAKPDDPELESLPPGQRLERYLREQRGQRLEVLRRREERR